MKNIIILLTFLWAITSYAVAPYGIKGQQQAATLYSNVHQFPNNQVTNLGGINALVETGNTNILSNPSFEHSTFSTSWTNSAGTFTQETSVLISGKASAKLVLAAQTMSLTQSSTLYAAQFADGVQGLAMVRIKSDIALSVCSIQAGTVSTTNCVTTNTDSKWGLYKVPFILGATSNGVSIASGSVTGTVYVDDAFVGAINLESQNGACITSDCTTTFSAKISTGNVITNENADWLSTSSGTTARTINFNSGIFTVIPNCTCTVGSDAYGASSADNTCSVNAASTSSVIINGTSNAVATSQPIILNCSKTGADFTQAEAKKTGNVFTTQCGANCVDVFSAKASSAGTSVVSAENVDWINGNCTWSPTGTLTCTPVTGTFTVTPNCTMSGTSNLSSSNYDYTTSTASSLVFGNRRIDSGVTFNDAVTIHCQKQGADFVATRTIQGTFNEVNVSPGISKPKTCSLFFGGPASTLAAPVELTTGTAIEVSDPCGAWSGPVYSATGVYIDATLANGTFSNSSPIFCSCVAFDSTSAAPGAVRECNLVFTTPDNTWSTTASGGWVGNIGIYSQSGSSADAYGIISCTGSAPQ